jgi:phosphopantothenoylcysteine decarboxylase/phosphopantothenate--cysteine ligase
MKIILGVSGSISAYKSIDLMRGLVNLGHEVVVVLTSGATEFVVANIYKYLGAKEVYGPQDDFKNSGVLHVELARWSDKLIIAPLSANTLSKFTQASPTDLLSSIFLAYEKNKPILVFPAMNTEMLTHPFVEENFEQIKKLKTLNNIFVSNTNVGKLACNDQGAGKLASVEEIIELSETITVKNINQKNILITTGATQAPLDPVRFLTNSSSGITGFFLAKNFLSAGHNVTVVAGKSATLKLDWLTKHPNFTLIRVTSVDDMYQNVHKHISNANIFIASAAVSDIEFDYTNSKIKKEFMGNTIATKPAKDILKSVIDLKQSKLKIVGFAAETDLSLEVLNKKMASKPVDMLIGTKVHNGMNGEELTGFNNDVAQYKFMIGDKITFEGNLEKSKLGFEMIKRLI